MFWAYFLMAVMMVIGLLLIFIILLQRGRGGGLAGALGGMGGQSAFGTRAGDVFTKITVAIAIVWVALAAFSGWMLRDPETRFPGGEQVGPEVPTAGPLDEEAPTSPAFPEAGDDVEPPAGDGP